MSGNEMTLQKLVFSTLATLILGGILLAAFPYRLETKSLLERRIFRWFALIVYLLISTPIIVASLWFLTKGIVLNELHILLVFLIITLIGMGFKAFKWALFDPIQRDKPIG